MKHFAKYAPPGLDWEREYKSVLGMLAYSVIASLIFFGWHYSNDRGKLFYRGDELIPGAKIAPFPQLVDDGWLNFGIVTVMMAAYVVSHWNYYRQGSKSIYLMRRLPDRGLLARTCLVLPALWAGMVLLAGAATTALYFGIYVLMTPQVCLPWT